jgi:hypothetical protein
MRERAVDLIEIAVVVVKSQCAGGFRAPVSFSPDGQRRSGKFAHFPFRAHSNFSLKLELQKDFRTSAEITELRKLSRNGDSPHLLQSGKWGLSPFHSPRPTLCSALDRLCAQPGAANDAVEEDVCALR